MQRMDLLLIGLPMVVHASAVAWQRQSVRQLLKTWIIGFSPLLILAAIFDLLLRISIPNTYYAKLHTGIPKIDLYEQGLVYFLDSLRRDPTTLSAIAVSLLLCALDVRARFAALGIGLYLVYVVNIGGDFMTGVFLQCFNRKSYSVRFGTATSAAVCFFSSRSCRLACRRCGQPTKPV